VSRFGRRRGGWQIRRRVPPVMVQIYPNQILQRQHVHLRPRMPRPMENKRNPRQWPPQPQRHPRLRQHPFRLAPPAPPTPPAAKGPPHTGSRQRYIQDDSRLRPRAETTINPAPKTHAPPLPLHSAAPRPPGAAQERSFFFNKIVDASIPSAAPTRQAHTSPAGRLTAATLGYAPNKFEPLTSAGHPAGWARPGRPAGEHG